MRNVFSATNSWDFCLFLLGVFHTPLFTYVQGFVATCDTEIFTITCWIGTYIVILVIKNNNKDKH